MALVQQSQPLEIAWSRHPLTFVCRSDAAGTVQIRQELYKASDDSLIHKTANLPVDDNGDVSYDWSKIITDEVSGEIPALVKLGSTHAKSTLAYYVKYVEVIAGVEGVSLDSSDRYAIFGSNEFFLLEYNYQPIDVAKDYLFQTSKPLVRELYIEQEEVLSVLFTKDIAVPALTIRLVYTDATDDTLSENLEAAVKGEIRTFDLSNRAWNYVAEDPAKTIAKIEVSFNGSTGDTIAYTVDHNGTKRLRNFIYANNSGGFDMLGATGIQEQKDVNEGEIFINEKNAAQVVQQHRVDVFVQGSGFKPKPEIKSYIQLREINRAYQVLDNQLLAGLTIIPQTTDGLNDGKNLNEFTFEYMFGDGRQDFDTINALVI